MKGTNCEPRFAWISITDLEGFWEDMRRIFFNWFYFFYNQLKVGNRSNRLNNTPEKHIEHAFHKFHQIRPWSSNYYSIANFWHEPLSKLNSNWQSKRLKSRALEILTSTYNVCGVLSSTTSCSEGKTYSCCRFLSICTTHRWKRSNQQ